MTTCGALSSKPLDGACLSPSLLLPCVKPPRTHPKTRPKHQLQHQSHHKNNTKGTVDEAGYLFPGQAALQVLLLLVAFAAVPWMLLPKPLTLKKRHEASLRAVRVF